MNKRKIFVAAIALGLVAILSMGSLAWFTDSDSVANDFMIASSEDDAEKVFSVDVYEMEDTDDDGVGDKRTDTGITYNYEDQDVTPGATLSKEAYVENTGRYDQYVRVIVTLSDVTVWKDVLGITSITEVIDLNEFFTVADDFDDTWYKNDAEIAYDAEADTLTYVYYYNGVLSDDAAAVPFISAVTIPETLTKEHVVAMDGAFDLDIVAEAVQAENVLDTYGAVEYKNAIDSFAKIA